MWKVWGEGGHKKEWRERFGKEREKGFYKIGNRRSALGFRAGHARQAETTSHQS